MSILKISKLGHPILLQKCNEVQNITGKETKKIIHDMTETMLDSKGIGLAAPQVHIKKQIIIFRMPEEEQDDEIKIMALIKDLPSYLVEYFVEYFQVFLRSIMNLQLLT